MARTQIDSSLLANVSSAKLAGTTTNDSAAAGIIGEYVSSTAGVVNVPATGVYGDITSIVLTAGDWDVSALVTCAKSTSTWSRFDAGISTNSGNSGAGLGQGNNFVGIWVNSSTTPVYVTNPIPVFRMSLSATTTVYLKFLGVYTGGQPQVDGAMISARRVR